MATTTSPAAPQPITHFGRITGVFFSPKETFADIARRPSWILPIVVLTILGLCVSYTMNKKIDWESFLRTKNEKSPRFANLSEEQKQQQLAPQVKGAPYFTYAIGGLATIIGTLVLALVYMGAFNVFSGAGLRYNQAMGIVSHGYMPGALAAILIIITLMLRPPGESTPENMLASHLGTLLSSDATRWQMSLLSSFELFWLWHIVLFSIGFSAANPKKITIGKALTIIGGIWLVYVLISVGLTAAFS